MLNKFSLCVSAILVVLSLNTAFSRRERLRELVHVCTGHNLLNVIKRACAIHKRNQLTLIEPTYPPRILLEDVVQVCCDKPCPMSLFVKLCY